MTEKTDIVTILQTSTDPSEILNKLTSSLGQEATDSLVEAIKKTGKKSNSGSAGKEKYLMDKTHEVANLLSRVEQDLSEIYKDLPIDQTIKLDLKATVGSKVVDGVNVNNVSAVAKTNYDATKKLLIVNSSAEPVDKKSFAEFGKKPYRSKSSN